MIIRVKILRNTVAARRAVMVGEVLDLDEREASLLIAMRKAQEINAPTTLPAAEVAAVPEPSGAVATQSIVDSESAAAPDAQVVNAENAEALIGKIKRRVRRSAKGRA